VTRVNLHARRLVLLTAEPTGLDNVVLEQTVRVHGAPATITVAEGPKSGFPVVDSIR
jgi:hypothetical protein